MEKSYKGIVGNRRATRHSATPLTLGEADATSVPLFPTFILFYTSVHLSVYSFIRASGEHAAGSSATDVHPHVHAPKKRMLLRVH